MKPPRMGLGRAARSAGLVFGIVLAAGLDAGCVGLKLTGIKSTEQRPSNVAIYFKVADHSGNPLGGLTADRFRIYEDGQLVSQYESKQTILNPEVAAVHYTLLLVDMSGSVSASGTVGSLVQAVSTFTDRVEKQQKVGIYAFDGSADLYPIVPFTDQTGNAKAGAAQLATFKPKDPSTNLNGGIVKALDELDNALGKATQPLKFGTLVVFTDGTDRANRVPEAQMEQHIKEMPFDVFAIGLGAEIKPTQLAKIGKSGTAMAADQNAIVKAFDDVGAKVEARENSYYLLSYCSPSRAGKHQVRIEAAVKDGNSEQVGDLTSDFDATGFAPGCDPNTPPSFDVTRGDTLAPPPPAPTPAPASEKPKKTEEKKERRPAHVAAPAQERAPAPAPAAAAPPSPAKPAQEFNP